MHSTKERLRSLRNQRSTLHKKKEEGQKSVANGGRILDVQHASSYSKSPRTVRSNKTWTKQVESEVSLAPEEVQLCKEVFHLTAASPFVCKAPTRRITEMGMSAVVLPSQTVVNSALQTLGIFLDQDTLSRVIKRHVRASDDSVALRDFVAIVHETKQVMFRKRRRDADVQEAYTGLGGSLQNLSENGGIPSLNLHDFMKNMGVRFDEAAKIDNEGHLVDFDYENSESSESDKENNEEDAHSPARTKQHPAANLFSLTTVGESMKRFRICAKVIIAVHRLRKTLVPWFLDAAALKSSYTLISANRKLRRRVEFRPASKWEGRVHGYMFTRGLLGLGYYIIAGPLPTFHIDAFAEVNKTRVAKNVPQTAFGMFELEDPITLPPPAPGEEGVPEAVREIRFRAARGKEILQKALAEKQHDFPPPGELLPVPPREMRGSTSTPLTPRRKLSRNCSTQWVGPVRDSRRSVVEGSADVPMPRESEGGKESDIPVLTVPDTPLLPEKEEKVDPQLGEVPSATCLSIGKYVMEKRERMMSGLFTPASLNRAGTPVEMQFSQAVFTAINTSCMTELAEDDDFEVCTTNLHTLTNVTGFAPSTNDEVFRQFERQRVDRDPVVQNKRRLEWKGATLLQKSQQTDRFKREAMVQEERAMRADKRVCEVLREVVISIMACKRSTHITALWKRNTEYVRQADRESIEDDTKKQLLDLSWLAWRESMEEMDNIGSDQLSRTFTERLQELDDQYDPDWDDEYEATNDPEMGVKLARLAQEMGLRTGDNQEEDDVVDDEYERLSQLSDIVTMQRLIPYEEFSAFFDRYRVYKGHHHVNLFQLPARPKKPEASVAEMFKDTVPLSQIHPHVDPPTSYADETVDGFSSQGQNLLVTLSGGLVQPVRGLTYQYTPRREGDGLYKGTARFSPLDWTGVRSDIERFDAGERTYDNVETTLLRKALNDFCLREQFRQDNKGDESSEDEPGCAASPSSDSLQTPKSAHSPQNNALTTSDSFSPRAPITPRPVDGVNWTQDATKFFAEENGSPSQVMPSEETVSITTRLNVNSKAHHSTAMKRVHRAILMKYAEAVANGKQVSIDPAVLAEFDALQTAAEEATRPTTPTADAGGAHPQDSPSPFCRPTTLSTTPTPPQGNSFLEAAAPNRSNTRVNSCLAPVTIGKPSLLPIDRLRMLQEELTSKNPKRTSAPRVKRVVRRNITKAKADRKRAQCERERQFDALRAQKREKIQSQRGPQPPPLIDIRTVDMTEMEPPASLRIEADSGLHLSPHYYEQMQSETFFAEIMDDTIREADLQPEEDVMMEVEHEQEASSVRSAITPVPPTSAEFFSDGLTPSVLSPTPTPAPDQRAYRIFTPSPRSRRAEKRNVFEHHIQRTYLSPQPCQKKLNGARRPRTPFW